MEETTEEVVEVETKPNKLSDDEREKMRTELELVRKRQQGLEQALKHDRRYMFEKEEVDQIKASHKQELKSLKSQFQEQMAEAERNNKLRVFVAQNGFDPDFAHLAPAVEFDDSGVISNGEAILEAINNKLAPHLPQPQEEQPQEPVGEIGEIEAMGNIFNMISNAVERPS